MSEGLILSIDCGTQSIRALLFDSEGKLITKEKAEFEPYYSNYPGWAEQDVDVYWRNLCKVCKSMKNNSPKSWKRVIGVTLTTQRDTCINVDKNGNSLRPAIIWLDKMVYYSKIYQPDEKNAKIYSKLYKRVYKRIYANLKDLYKDIKEITNYPDY